MAARRSKSNRLHVADPKARLAALNQLERSVAVTSDEDLVALVASLPAEHRAEVARLSGVPGLSSSAPDNSGPATSTERTEAEDAAAAQDTEDTEAAETGGTHAPAEGVDATPVDTGEDGAAGAEEATEAARQVVPALREAMRKGRVNGTAEALVAVLTDRALADTIEALGDSADLPSHDDLQEVLPGIAERHGLPATRMMLASAVAGDAPARSTLQDILKHDPVFALPKLPATERVATEQPAAPPPSPEELAERERLKAQRAERRAKQKAEAEARRQQAAAAKRKR